MMSVASPAFKATGEGFAAAMGKQVNQGKQAFRGGHDGFKVGPKHPATHSEGFNADPNADPNAGPMPPMPPMPSMPSMPSGPPSVPAALRKEKFTNYGPNAAGARDSYEPMGQFDGVRLSTGNSSSWRYTAPNEPLQGNYPKFEVGPDNLFMFKDNQCKPECCGSSMSCDGGCVCTTPEQREYINTRGGNRTRPESGV